jgi:hypothetical protein
MRERREDGLKLWRIGLYRFQSGSPALHEESRPDDDGLGNKSSKKLVDNVIDFENALAFKLV